MVTAEDYGMYNHLNGETVNPKSEKPYLVFTPFKNFCLNNLTVAKPDYFSDFDFETHENL